MFGRLGSVVGANVTALLLENQCETVFYMSGSVVIGKVLFNYKNVFNFNRFFLYLATGILTFFIPNIHEIVETRMSMVQNEPRLSVASFR